MTQTPDKLMQASYVNIEDDSVASLQEIGAKNLNVDSPASPVQSLFKIFKEAIFDILSPNESKDKLPEKLVCDESFQSANSEVVSTAVNSEELVGKQARKKSVGSEEGEHDRSRFSEDFESAHAILDNVISSISSEKMPMTWNDRVERYFDKSEIEGLVQYRPGQDAIWSAPTSPRPVDVPQLDLPGSPKETSPTSTVKSSVAYSHSGTYVVSESPEEVSWRKGNVSLSPSLPSARKNSTFHIVVLTPKKKEIFINHGDTTSSFNVFDEDDEGN